MRWKRKDNDFFTKSVYKHEHKEQMRVMKKQMYSTESTVVSVILPTSVCLLFCMKCNCFISRSLCVICISLLSVLKKQTLK